MLDQFDINRVLQVLRGFANKLQSWTVEPSLWVQLGLIITVFIVAFKVGGPVLRSGLTRLRKATAKVPTFTRVWAALDDVATTIAWLVLQWLAIYVSQQQNWDHAVLLTVASLLSAWLIIRLLSNIVNNQGLARILSVSIWTIAALNIFGWLTPVVTLLDGWAVTVGSIRISPLTVVKIVVSLWLALWLANGLSKLVERRLERSGSTNAATRVLLAKVTRISLVMFAIIISLSAVGIDLTALAVFSGALGVGLGFGLQKIFSNLVSGVILLMDRSIKPGDVISLSNTFGWINHLGLRYTSVITRDGTEHLIPNEELITQRVENWSFSNNLVRLRIPIGISYHSDVRLAMRLCTEAAGQVKRVKQDPEPRTQLIGFGDSSVNLELRIWIDDPPQGRANVISEVLLQVWDKFHEHAIEIPFPQQDLHVKSFLGENDIHSFKQATAKSGDVV